MASKAAQDRPYTASPQMEAATQHFVQAWGEMASAWGISKTMAQVYALLYASPVALDTDQIMDTLDISRGNANMNLHKLMEWGLVHKLGREKEGKDKEKEKASDSRKDRFTAEKDVFLLARSVIRERSEKEIKPVAEHLSEIAQSLTLDGQGKARILPPEEAGFKENLEKMAGVLQTVNTIITRVLPLLEHRNLKQIDTLLKLLGTDGKKHSKAN